MLRPYQQAALDQLYGWFRSNPTGHPCLVLPTGSGKSHIIAALCKDALTQWPDTRILMLTHVKELIEQNAEKLLSHWPDAPLGIYSAGLKSKEIKSITFGGIQSLRTKSADIGHVSLIIVDEAHLISHKAEGGYRRLIAELTQINPSLRVVGLTATPWRLGHGKISDGDALFDDLIEPVTIMELIKDGYLAPLRSKSTQKKLSTAGVHKRGGEYIESELQKAVDKDDQNRAIVAEIISRAEDRKSWLLFCTGVLHSHHIADELRAHGIVAETITGHTPANERDRILSAFKAGEIQAVTNANVLTTGFDAPNIDLIAFLRPTMSPTLYVQMAGRGMRIKDHTDHCLVLDFAGLVSAHGAITDVQPPSKKGNGDGECPVKVCDECYELVHLSVKVCPCCGFEFPPPKPKPIKLHDDDIMGGIKTMPVSSWNWSIHVGKKSGLEMFMVRYYGSLHKPPVNEYLVVNNEGYAGERARITFAQITQDCHATIAMTLPTMQDAVDRMNRAAPPAELDYKMDGKYPRILKRSWN